MRALLKKENIKNKTIKFWKINRWKLSRNDYLYEMYMNPEFNI